MDTNAENIAERKPSPWGFWATIGFSLLNDIVSVAVGAVIAIAFIVIAKGLHPDIEIDSLASNGLLLAIATLAGTPLTISLSLLFATLRRGLTIKEYFCLHNPGIRQYVKWGFILLLFVLCSDGLSALLGKPIVAEFMVDAYVTAQFTPLLWLAMIVAAPLAEEVVFRGFLFKGIENSRIGGTGAILISSLWWTVLHIQYDLYGMGTIFVAGLLLGIARLKSRSLYIVVMMHAVMNLIATIETAIYVKTVLN
jgi:membrane protease YdiL (CAAX protease family)